VRAVESEQHQGNELTGDQSHATVLVEVGGVALPVSTTLGRHQPAGVCVPKSSGDAAQATLMPDVWGCEGRPRYRLARLRELLGDDLDDPDARFELEIALRTATA
jgi:hypothetical protein